MLTRLLSVYSNHLVGPIPAGISALTKLTYVKRMEGAEHDARVVAIVVLD